MSLPVKITPTVSKSPSVPTSPVRVEAVAHVLKHPGSEDLTGYPLLIHGHAADDHGIAVRTEDHQVAVYDLCMDVALGLSYEAVAAKRGTSAEHVRQAVAFATARGYLKS